MITGVVNQQVEECFTVADNSGNLISGIDATAFTTYVYNPSNNEVSDFVSESIIELGNGSYKYLFTPDTVGTWYVVLTHPTYFPWGKLDDVQVYTSDLTSIYEIVRRILGLTHENVYIDETVFDENGNMISARVRIYENSSDVGTDIGIIESYLITADSTVCGQFNFWKQVKL